MFTTNVRKEDKTMAKENLGNKELETKRENTIQSRCNICEEDGNIVLRLEMPGVEKGSVDINVDNNLLKITGKRSEPSIEGRYILRERRYGDFYHVFTIDETIDRDKIEASLENGVLTITLHQKEAEKPKKIEVKAT